MTHDSNDPFIETIENRLRHAHQQVSCRAEWAEQLARKLSDESASRHRVSADVGVPKRADRTSPFSLPVAVSLAVAVMLMISVVTWIAFEKNNTNLFVRNHPQPVSPTDGMSDQPATPMAESNSTPVDTKLNVTYGQDDAMASAEPPRQGTGRDSIKAAAGYLAAPLFAEDPDFEIYVVLPTVQFADLSHDH